MSRRRKSLIVGGATLATAILISIIHHYQLRSATKAYIAELKAKGEPMELAQVLPPSVPPEQNGADTFRDATALLEVDKSLPATSSYSAMKMVAPGKAMICWQQADARGAEATNSWEEVAAAVAQNAKAFVLLQQIIEKPIFDFQIAYEQGVADLNFDHLCLAQSKRAAQRLSTAALCDLHRGDTISAVQNLRAMIALTKATREERLIISELVRMAIASIALTVNWEMLQATNLNDGQLAALQRDWMSLEFIRPEENALAMERVTGEITLAKWRSSKAKLEKYLEKGKVAQENIGIPQNGIYALAKARVKSELFLWRYWWSYPDELRSHKGYGVLLNTMRQVETNGSFLEALSAQNAALDQLGISKLNNSFVSILSGKTDFHSMLSESIVTLAGVARKVMRVETAKQMVVNAIALKRYQLKHGNYPPNLDSLVPEFMTTIPTDPVDGKPLHYRLKADGTFLLYSVGDNGKDDGGDPSLEKGCESSGFQWQHFNALDWVWPQPASPEEIQAYDASQAKK
jgi:hypothetical protein